MAGGIVAWLSKDRSRGSSNDLVPDDLFLAEWQRTKRLRQQLDAVERLLAKGVQVKAPANPLRGISTDSLSAYLSPMLAR